MKKGFSMAKDMNRRDRRSAVKGRHTNYYTKKYHNRLSKEYARSILRRF